MIPMTVLLDTHALIWWFNEPTKLSRRVQRLWKPEQYDFWFPPLWHGRWQ